MMGRGALTTRLRRRASGGGLARRYCWVRGRWRTVVGRGRSGDAQPEPAHAGGMARGLGGGWRADLGRAGRQDVEDELEVRR